MPSAPLPDSLTLALRFRDIEVHDTIREHTTVISRLGFVWWGWWHKPAEVVPRAAFHQMSAKIGDLSKVDVFLVNSGRQRLYRAGLTELIASDTEQGIRSPQPNGVPNYYSSEVRKAWFKFSEINLVEPRAIESFSYVELPEQEFVYDPASAIFDGKRVAHLAELIQRPRTIWFLREGEADDPRERIVLNPSYYLFPARRGSDRTSGPDATRLSARERDGRGVDGQGVASGDVLVFEGAPSTPFVTDPVGHPASQYLLHLSDLHFGPNYEFPLDADAPTTKSLALLIRDDLKELYGDMPPIAVVVTGDLTWQGLPEEFDQAGDFLRTLGSFYGLGERNYVVVPGNHDIAWSDQSGIDYNPRQPVSKSSAEAEEAYRAFVRDVLGFEPNDALSMGRRYVTSTYRLFDVIGLNSSRLEGRRFAGYGFVTRDAYFDAARAMGWTSEPHDTKRRLTVLHHHLLPTVPHEEITYDMNLSVTIDAVEILSSALEFESDLVLHGHMHQPIAVTYARNAGAVRFPGTRTLGIHGAGSAGLKRHLLGRVGRNCYTIYDFQRDVINVRIRVLSESIADRFEDYAKLTLEDNDDGGGLKQKAHFESGGVRLHRP